MRYLKAWRPTPSFVISCISLFVALSGTAIALQGQNGVKSDDIAPGAVHRGDVAKNAINSAKVANDSLTGSDVNESSLDGSQIPGIPSGGGGGSSTPSGPAGGDLTGTYPNPNIAAGAIGPANLQTNVITADGTGIDGTTKIAPNSINFQEMDDGAVHSPQILSGAVTAPKLASITEVTNTVNNTTLAGVQCPAGSQVLSGGGVAPTLSGSVRINNGWGVSSATTGTVTAVAYCLGS